MKTKTLNYIAALVAVLTFTLPTLAVDPVAVWEGTDLAQAGTVTKNSIDLILPSDATYADNVVTIGNTGIYVRDSASVLNSVKTATIIVKYSDYTVPSAPVALLTMGGSYDSRNNYKDYIGIIGTADGVTTGMVSSVIWNNDSNKDVNDQYGVVPAGTTAKLALAYDYNANPALRAYAVDDGIISLFQSNDIKGSGVRTRVMSVFGCYNTSASGCVAAATGTKVLGVAFFTSSLSEDDIATYVFPSDAAQIAAEGTIKVSEINTKANGAKKAVVTWTGDNAELDIDAELDCIKIELICDGNLTLAGDKPSETELAKFDVDDVTGYIFRDWVDMASIGVNFHSGQGSDATSAAIAGSTWYNVTNNVGTSTEIFGDGLSTVTWSSANTYGYSHASGSILNGYLDDVGSHAQVTITHIPWETYDVLVYCATDTENRKFSPVTINDTLYTCDSNGIAMVALDATETWGQSRNATAVLGTNVIRLNEVTASTLRIVGGANANNARGGIAAIQILKMVGEKNIEATDDIAISTINKQISKDYTVNLTIAAGKTITFDEAPIFAALNVIADGEVTVTEGDDYTVTSDDVGKVAFSGVTLLTIDNAMAFMEGTPSYPVKVIKDGGFSTFPYKETSLAVDLTIASPVNEENVKHVIGDKKNVIFEDGFSMTTASWILGNKSGVTQNYTQNAGEILLTKEDVNVPAINPELPLTLNLWSSTVNYTFNGGSIKAPYGLAIFGWDGYVYMTVGNGDEESEDTTAYLSALGFDGISRNNAASLTIKKNGTVSFGSQGFFLGSKKPVTLEGGQLEAYDTAVLSIAHEDGLKVTKTSILCTNGEGEDPIALTVSNKVTIAEGATLYLGGNVEIVGDITTAEGAYLDLSTVDTFDFGTRRPALAALPGSLAKFTLTDAEFANGKLSFKVNVGDNLEEITTDQVKVYKQDGVTEVEWVEENPITITNGVATFKFQTTKPITEETNVSDLDPDLTGVVVVKGAETAEDAFTVTFDAALPEGVTELRITGYANLMVAGDITTLPSANISLGDNANVTIDRPFDTDFTIPEGTILNLVGGDDLAGRKDYNLFTINGTLTTSGYCRLNNKTVVNTTGELVVETGALTYTGAEQKMKGTLTVKSGTELNGCHYDLLNYGAACRVNVYGTIDLGSARWSFADDTKLFIYDGGLIKGTGDGYGMLDYFENGGRLVAQGTCEIAGPIRLRNSGETTKICTCRDTTLTISGAIVEKGNLEKTWATTDEGNTAPNSGNAFTWLTGANTFKGNLTHVANSGTLGFTADTSFSADNAITLGSGTALQLGKSNETGSIVLNNTIVNGSRIDVYLDATLNGAITGAGPINLKTANAALRNYGNTIASTGAITGAGTLEIDYTNVVKSARTITTLTGLQEAAWTGTFAIKNLAWQNWNFGALGRADGGKVKLTGVKGFGPSSTDAECAAEVILADDGDTKALTITDGYSTVGTNKDQCLYIFDKLSGSGTFCFNKDSVTAQYRIKDISDFTGAFGNIKSFRVAVGDGTDTTDPGRVMFDDGITIPAGLSVTSPVFGSTINFTSDEELVIGSAVMTVAGTNPTLDGVIANGSFALTQENKTIKLASTFTEPSLTVGEITYEAGKDFIGGKVTVNMSGFALGDASEIKAMLYYKDADGDWVKVGEQAITADTTSVTFEDTKAEHLPAGSMPNYKVAFAYSATGLADPVVFKGADDEYAAYGENFNTVTGWIDEDGGDKFGTTGTWEGTSSNDEEGIAISREAGEYATFKPNTAMKGFATTINTDVSFSAVDDTLEGLNNEEAKPEQTGVTLVQDGENYIFAYYAPAEGVWTNLSSSAAVELNKSYKVIIKLDYAAHKGAISIFDGEAEIDSATFQLSAETTAFEELDFTGDGKVVSLQGEYYDSNLAEVNGTEYATLEAAIEAAKGTDDEIILLNTNVTVPDGWLIEGNKLIKKPGGLIFYLIPLDGEGKIW